jgi:hypothetical protein
MAMQRGPECWMEYLLRSVPVRTQRNKLGILFVFDMSGKKETAVFDNSELSFQRASFIHQPMTLFS